jgi:hypothetical protein
MDSVGDAVAREFGSWVNDFSTAAEGIAGWLIGGDSKAKSAPKTARTPKVTEEARQAPRSEQPSQRSSSSVASTTSPALVASDGLSGPRRCVREISPDSPSGGTATSSEVAWLEDEIRRRQPVESPVAARRGAALAAQRKAHPLPSASAVGGIRSRASAVAKRDAVHTEWKQDREEQEERGRQRRREAIAAKQQLEEEEAAAEAAWRNGPHSKQLRSQAKEDEQQRKEDAASIARRHDVTAAARQAAWRSEIDRVGRIRDSELSVIDRRLRDGRL